MKTASSTDEGRVVYSKDGPYPVTNFQAIKLTDEASSPEFSKHSTVPLQSEHYFSDISHYKHGLYVHKFVNRGDKDIESIFLQNWLIRNFRPHMQSLTVFYKGSLDPTV